MFVIACQTYNEGGRALPRHELATLYPSRIGWLSFKSGHDSCTGRPVMQARLLTEDRQNDVFPPLTYACMMDADNGVMHLRGEQLDPLSGKFSAMGWYCVVVDGRRHGQDPRGPLLM